MRDVEVISADEHALAYIVRAAYRPSETTFPTPADLNLQVGLIVYPEDGEVARHRHRELERRVVGTAEVIVVREGRCALDVYDDDGELVATRELETGDVMLMVGGGHGFRMLEPTVLLEVKQGPYVGADEKERF